MSIRTISKSNIRLIDRGTHRHHFTRRLDRLLDGMMRSEADLDIRQIRGEFRSRFQPAYLGPNIEINNPSHAIESILSKNYYSVAFVERGGGGKDNSHVRLDKNEFKQHYNKIFGPLVRRSLKKISMALGAAMGSVLGAIAGILLGSAVILMAGIAGVAVSMIFALLFMRKLSQILHGLEKIYEIFNTMISENRVTHRHVDDILAYCVKIGGERTAEEFKKFIEEQGAKLE